MPEKAPIHNEPENCIMCGILNNEDWVPFRTIFKRDEVESEFIYQDSRVTIIADIAPMVPGYALILTNNHVPSFAFMRPELLQKVEELKKQLRDYLKPVFGEVVFFEHGPTQPSSSAGCCIDHAHLHVVPTDVDLLPLISRDYDFSSLPNFGNINYNKWCTDYLYYENQTGDMFLTSVIGSTPSQYFRRVLSQALGGECAWNWCDYINATACANTKSMILETRKKYADFSNQFNARQ